MAGYDAGRAITTCNIDPLIVVKVNMTKKSSGVATHWPLQNPQLRGSSSSDLVMIDQIPCDSLVRDAKHVFRSAQLTS